MELDFKNEESHGSERLRQQQCSSGRDLPEKYSFDLRRRQREVIKVQASLKELGICAPQEIPGTCDELDGGGIQQTYFKFVRWFLLMYICITDVLPTTLSFYQFNNKDLQSSSGKVISVSETAVIQYSIWKIT